jgi:hypothetical protein
MATIKKAQLGSALRKAERQHQRFAKQHSKALGKQAEKEEKATKRISKMYPDHSSRRPNFKLKSGGKVKVKKAQKGCAIARETAKADKKAIRQWGKMANMSDKQIERQSRRDERASRREEARQSRPSGSKLRGNFMFKAGGKVKKASKKK